MLWVVDNNLEKLKNYSIIFFKGTKDFRSDSKLNNYK